MKYLSFVIVKYILALQLLAYHCLLFFSFCFYSVQDRLIKVTDGLLYGGLFTVGRSEDISISLITSWKKSPPTARKEIHFGLLPYST